MIKSPNNGPTFSKSTKKVPLSKDYPDGTEDKVYQETRYGQPGEPKWNPRKETWSQYKNRMRGFRGWTK